MPVDVLSFIRSGVMAFIGWGVRDLIGCWVRVGSCASSLDDSVVRVLEGFVASASMGSRPG